MALSDKISTLTAELSQRQKAQTARAKLQNLRSVVVNTNIEIQTIADSGDFDTLDADVKNALVAAWDVCKAAEAALGNATIAELLDWKP